jgi:Cu/Ag efflux protein CusF
MMRLWKLVVLAGFMSGILLQGQQPTAGAREGQSHGDQSRPEAGRRFRGVFGTITEISSSSLKLKMRDGTTATVHIGEETQFRKERQPAKLSDFKVGDNVAVRGDSTGNGSWNARMISSALNPDEARARFREGLGKQFVVGDIKSLDPPKITIQRVDGVEQTIEADENTSFKRQNESITLPDLKAGDTVLARGELKDGVFVPSEIRVVDPQMAQRMKQRSGEIFLSEQADHNSPKSTSSPQQPPKQEAPKQ